MLGKSKVKVWMVGGPFWHVKFGVGRRSRIRPGNNPNCPGGFDQLNLTADQKTKLNDLREKTGKNGYPAERDADQTWNLRPSGAIQPGQGQDPGQAKGTERPAEHTPGQDDRFPSGSP